jgi:hypothetical protein
VYRHPWRLFFFDDVVFMVGFNDGAVASVPRMRTSYGYIQQRPSSTGGHSILETVFDSNQFRTPNRQVGQQNQHHQSRQVTSGRGRVREGEDDTEEGGKEKISRY